MWVLILTLIGYKSQAITTAGPFDTSIKCELAAKAWVEGFSNEQQRVMGNAAIRPSALCVRTK